jgi:hypothetical protein
VIRFRELRLSHANIAITHDIYSHVLPLIRQETAQVIDRI